MCRFVNNAKHGRIDKCMRNIVGVINDHTNYETLACCCGHNKYSPSLVVRSGDEEDSAIFELFSMKVIMRKKRFYKKDRKGYYYIPEVL